MIDEQHTASQWPVFEFTEIDGTNAEALRMSERGERGPTWLLAETQSGGRGRLGRTWHSPKGNLFASALFPFSGVLSDAPLVCFSAGLAALDAINQTCANPAGTIQLKWPNDLVAGRSKVGGILIETAGQHAPISMVVGFGLNLAKTPEAPGVLATSVTQELACPTPTPAAYLAALDKAFRQRLSNLATYGFEPTRRAWLEQTVHRGQPLEVTLDNQAQTVSFVDLANDGGLLVRTQDGTIACVRTGEVGLVNQV